MLRPRNIIRVTIPCYKQFTWTHRSYHGLRGCLKFPMFVRAVTFNEAEIINQQRRPIKNVLKNVAIFNGKHLCWSLFSTKLQAGLQDRKKRLQHRCFPLNIATFLKTPILKNIRERLSLVKVS